MEACDFFELALRFEYGTKIGILLRTDMYARVPIIGTEESVSIKQPRSLKLFSLVLPFKELECLLRLGFGVSGFWRLVLLLLLNRLFHRQSASLENYWCTCPT